MSNLTDSSHQFPIQPIKRSSYQSVYLQLYHPDTATTFNPQEFHIIQGWLKAIPLEGSI
ncbi:hypothetical protein [Calothrix sp. NIES-3974]|uniref:hypothetical protein n=1 Tax=Calothrix sp. NIES-3974 TaxID=2005462 RepID=UPI0012FD43C9|nr:hypothetical protein [Calothrix sp. NIES-3974]